MIGVRKDPTTMRISVTGSTSSTFGIVVSGCPLPTTRPLTLSLTTPLINYGSRRMVVGGYALTTMSYWPQSRPASYWTLSTTCSKERPLVVQTFRDLMSVKVVNTWWRSGPPSRRI
jgi:hypothetical protein